MSTKLQDLLALCIREADAQTGKFNLYVSGNSWESRRSITGYLILLPTERVMEQRRVLLNASQIAHFNIAEMRNAMLTLGFDFTQPPVAQGTGASNWLMCVSEAPKNFSYLTGANSRNKERRAQDENFEQFREFEREFPRQ